MGSPPQMETIGAPHSSRAFKHCSTLSFSRMVSAYSRMRPQPVHVRLQACRGSSIITSGNLSAPVRRLPAMYFVMLAVRVQGNLKSASQADRQLQEAACSGPMRTGGNSVDTGGTSNKKPLEILCP